MNMRRLWVVWGMPHLLLPDLLQTCGLAPVEGSFHWGRLPEVEGVCGHNCEEQLCRLAAMCCLSSPAPFSVHIKCQHSALLSWACSDVWCLACFAETRSWTSHLFILEVSGLLSWRHWVPAMSWNGYNIGSYHTALVMASILTQSDHQQ